MMRKRSLSQKLFRTYTGWFAVYLIVLIAIFVSYMSRFVREDIQDMQQRLMESIDENVQNYFETMNAFSLELLNSQIFKETAVDRLPEEFENGRSTAELFSTLYSEAYKMIPLKYNIGIVVGDEHYIWMGRHYYINDIKKEIHTYDRLVRDEKPVIQYLPENEYLESTSPQGEEGKSFIALARSMDYRNRYLNGKAVLEILVEKENFLSEMQRLSAPDNSSGLTVNVYDSYGNELYRESDMDLTEYVEHAGEREYGREGDFIAVRQVFDGNVTIVYTRDHGAYVDKLFEFWLIVGALSVLVLGITFVVTFRISKQVSRPIYRMCENVRRIDLKTGKGYEEINTDIDELCFLSSSLKQMNDQISSSVGEIISLKEYELHAKMLALQAQMQPHFLFNTLSTIASMAEEEGNDRIYRICMHLNSMFRYIVSGESGGVRMFEEIRHIESYVEIMKERFPQSHVEIDIPLEIMDCRIPKLTIQPLVENAFKYCDRQAPCIRVEGKAERDEKWTVTVSDNGNGFSEDVKREIMRKCSESLESEKTLLNKIDGMGLVNVFVRMRLFYGGDMIYRIEEGTTRITIGGKRDGRIQRIEDQDSRSRGRN